MLEPNSLTEGFFEFELPGGSPAILLKRLGTAADGSMWSAVRFPAGFFRAGPVYLAVEEAYFMLEGEIFYSGLCSPAGSYTVIPAGAARLNTRTEQASMAVARFDGAPKWLERPPQGPVGGIHTETGRGRTDGPLGPWVPLGSHGSVAVGKLTESVPDEHPGAVLVSLTDLVVVEVAADEQPPSLTPPIVAWVPTANPSRAVTA